MATIPQTPSPPRLARTRWLWVVRVSAVIPLLIFLLTFVSSLGHKCSIPPQDWGAVLFDSCPLWLPYVYLLGRLWRKAERSGLRIAVVWGLLMLALSTYGASSRSDESGLGWRLGFGFIALSQAVMVASAIMSYRGAAAEQANWKTQSRGYLAAVVYLVIFFIAAEAAPSNLRSPAASNQAAAVNSLRAINTAEFTYAETHKAGYSPTLAALGGGPAGTQPSASNAGLIDSVLATGRMMEYSFTYFEGPKDSAGSIQSYAVVARPLDRSCGPKSYYTDESGVIRQTSENRPATAKDPPLGY